MLKSLSYNYFYYKNAILCKIFPDYVASNINDLFYTPRMIKQQEYESDFEKNTKHNVLKIPTEGYKERMLKFEENNKDRKDMKLTRIPNLPEEINVLEFTPEENAPKRNFSILCVHGWEGRGTNFFKFIPKLTQEGFKVLCPDFPLHGNTKGEETGCHVFGYSLNCILNYIDYPVVLLVHSLGNGATCMNYYLSDEKTRKKIKGFIGIGVPDKFTDYIIHFGNIVGLDENTINLFINKNTEKLGLDVHFFVVSETIENFIYPILIVHDENDKEIDFNWAVNVSKHVNEKYQKYHIGDKEFPCFHQTKGLGHRRILRDDGVVDVVVNFICNGILEN